MSARKVFKRLSINLPVRSKNSKTDKKAEMSPAESKAATDFFNKFVKQEFPNAKEATIILPRPIERRNSR